MGTAVLSIPPSTDQIRLARLVAGAAARRCGVAEDALDDVRQAVSEACTLAMVKHQEAALAAEVRIEIDDDTETFSVRVIDQIPDSSVTPHYEDELALALISSLANRSDVHTNGPGRTVEMSWPVVEPSLVMPDLD